MSQWCSQTYVSGRKRGEVCPYRASEVVVPRDVYRPFLVCGYHARAYGPSIRYALNWSLEEVRRWRLGNLDELVSGA